MNTNSNTSRNYVVVNKILDKVNMHLKKNINFDFEYSRTDIVQRISQLVCLLITSEVSAQSIKKSINGGKTFFEFLPKSLKCNQILIDTHSGIVKPSFLLIFFNSFRFLLLWLFILISFLFSCFYKSRNFGSAALIFGIPNDLNDEKCLTNFEDYCTNTSNNVIRSSKGFVTQFGKKINSKSNLFIVLINVF